MSKNLIARISVAAVAIPAHTAAGLLAKLDLMLEENYDAKEALERDDKWDATLRADEWGPLVADIRHVAGNAA